MANRIDKENEIDKMFPISHRAEKSLDLQVNNVAKANLRIGESKQAAYNRIKDANDGKITPHDKGQNTGFHSWETYHKYKSGFQTFAHYCRCEYGVKHIEDIKPSMAVSFAKELGDLGYAKNTVNSFCSAIEKFGSFLKIDFHSEIKEYKKSEDYKGLEAKDTNTRAYDSPQKIIDAIGNEKAQMAAQLSLNYGLRLSDACHFKIDGDKMYYNSKNGMKTTKVLSPADAATVSRYTDEKGKFNLPVSTMKSEWGKACESAKVENTGFHGLRHNFAQGLYGELRGRGLNHKEACLVTSHEMNHSRAEITERYLR